MCLFGFRITAYGAAGGRSVLAVHKSHGVYITGDFLLQKDELLYILVGQEGEDACPNVSEPFYQYFCVMFILLSWNNMVTIKINWGFYMIQRVVDNLNVM